MATEKILQPLHPFYPVEAQLVGYIANEWSVPLLLGTFAAGCAGVIALTLAFVQIRNPNLSNKERVCVIWFVLTGSIHFFFEGYFALNHTRMPGQRDLFGQLWKEYAHSDSRYMTSDPFVLCMETITAVFWGPLSFLTAYLVTTQSPYRHPLQALVSLGQIYGDVLYYATSMFDHYYKGLTYFRPEAYYFWVYYFMMNMFWIIIPGFYLYSSMTASAAAFSALDKLSRGLKVNGYANGSAKKTI